MTSLRLVVFDVDGTLVDSLGHILAAMGRAFASVGRPAPDDASVRKRVGLGLEQAIAEIVPDAPAEEVDRLAAAYRAAFRELRLEGGEAGLAPLYPGAREALDRLAAMDDVLLAVATGKSRRGLDHVIEAHGLHRHFQALHCADIHPSKPHPAMLQAALADCGVGPGQAVMLGDTTFDMDMARAAGVAGLGVGWGNHPAAELHTAGAVEVLDHFDALDSALERIWERADG